MEFERLFKEHKNLVYNLALQYCQNTEDAEEITQDVFFKVYQKLHSFKNEANIKTWIYRICINTSLDFIKSKYALRRGLNLQKNRTSEIPFQNQNFNHPGAELEQKEGLKRLFQAINQLPENQKTVIILLKIEQNSSKETAEIMETSTKAVESLFQRAKTNLAKILLQQKDHE